MLLEPLLLDAQRGMCLQLNLMMKATTGRSSLRFHTQYCVERIFFRGHPKGFAIETGEVVMICMVPHVCLTRILIVILNRYINKRFWQNEVFVIDWFYSKLNRFAHVCITPHPSNKQYLAN